MKNYIYTFIIAVVITLSAIHAYNFYQIKKVVVQHEQALVQIINVLNGAAKQPAQPTLSGSSSISE